MTIGIIVSLTSTLRAFVGHYNNGERWRAMTTMTTKQQQQWEEDVEDECSHREGGTTLTRWASKATRNDMAFCCLLLFVQLDNYFILFNFSSSAEALSASAVARCHPPPTPQLTALHPPPSLLNSCACLGLSWKLEHVNCVLL